ncbi:MAG: LysR family transcriptional regulator [Aliishimia sp.]
MQQLFWNDLRVLLAVARAQSLSGAATWLGVNATTVSRRLKALELIAGTPLLLRDKAGGLRLTPKGLALAEQAEGMERHANVADTVLGRDMVLGGTVRLTAVPFLLNRFIAPKIYDFMQAHPALQVSLVPDNRNLSLTRREVDLAIRFGEPQEGGNAVLAQKIGDVRFSAFTARAFPSAPVADRPWLMYDPIAAHLPQAKWTEILAKENGAQSSGILLHDLETAFQTVLHTPSCAVLPDKVACEDQRLVRLEHQGRQAEMYRDVWLMRHRDMRDVDRIDAVVTWLTQARLFD